MLKFYKQLFSLVLFWLLFFLIQRIVFLAYHYSALQDVDFSNLAWLNWYALRYDLAATAYLILLPFLLLLANAIRPFKALSKILFIYNSCFIVLCSFINIIDISLYEAWGTKINSKALGYLDYPDEVITSALSTPIFALLVTLLIQVIIGIFILKKMQRPLPEFNIKTGKIILVALITLPILVIALRGGTQRKPINKNWGYFSEYAILNYASINGPWNLLYDMMHPVSYFNNPYTFFPGDTAKKLVSKCYTCPSSETVKILDTVQPNLVIIMLESWSADVIDGLGGEKEVTPSFNKLAEQGLLFTNFYANGSRTEQGLIAIMSGFPAQPKTSIVRDFGKFEKLPSILSLMDSAGYSSAAYYGANLDFANTGSYLRAKGFQKVLGEQDIPHSGRTLWGINDDEVLNFQANDLKNLKQPFVVLTLTISSHEPFEVPSPAVFKGNSLSQKYRNAVHYSDKCLGEYFEKVKKEKWYDNTLFVLVADHSHLYPRGRADNTSERYKIPMLFFGNVIKPEFRGKTISKYGSQTDIAATLLPQLNFNASLFHWSKDLLNPSSPSFSFFVYDDGFGWLNEKKEVVYDNNAGKLLLEKGINDSSYLDNGQAYLQALYQEYLEY